MITKPQISWMRYIIGDAGNVRRLYYAVKTASKIQADNLETLSYYYLKKYGSLTNLGSRKRGLKRQRSLEPHFSLARELDLLEWRERELWRITFGPGKAFIALWDLCGKEPPLALLLGQLLRYDRSFLIPFILALVESDYDFSRLKFKGLEQTAGNVWEEVWVAGREELKQRQRLFPDPKTVGKRTLLHHATARVRFLNSHEGLSLNIDKVRRLAELFFEFQFTPLPNDYYFLIGKALTDSHPKEISDRALDQLVIDGFSKLQRMGYASGFGLFAFVNELALPNAALDWEAFSSYIRRRKGISTSASFRRDDFLLTVDKKEIVMEEYHAH